jgi:hypothetical protein
MEKVALYLLKQLNNRFVYLKNEGIGNQPVK